MADRAKLYQERDRSQYIPLVRLPTLPCFDCRVPGLIRILLLLMKMFVLQDVDNISTPPALRTTAISFQISCTHDIMIFVPLQYGRVGLLLYSSDSVCVKVFGCLLCMKTPPTTSDSNIVISSLATDQVYYALAHGNWAREQESIFMIMDFMMFPSAL